MSENVHKNHRQRLRARYEREGADSLEVHELLELFLFDAIPRVITNPIAHRLLHRFGDLDGVLNAPFEQLIQVKGIGDSAARYIVNAAKEERERVEREISEKPVSSFPRAANYLIAKMRELAYTADTASSTVVLCLDETMHLTECRVYEGDRVLVILNDCIDAGAVKVIVGCGKRTSSEIMKNADLFGRFGMELCDVIEIDGFDARSVMDE